MRLSQVAIQLYTLREFCKTAEDYAATLRRVKEIGYQAIQISAVGPIPPETLRSIAEGEGLVIAATHEPGPSILDTPEAVIERLDALGTRYTAYPFPSQVNLRDEAIVEEWITKLERAAALFSQAGKGLCYHNHAMEFLPFRGKTIMDALFDQTTHLLGEPDTYWVQLGGGNPAAWCERLKGRLPLLHLKDYTVQYNESGQVVPIYTEIGNGNLDFNAIIRAADASGCEWFIVEQDSCPGDPFDSIAQSFRYLKENLVSA